MKGLLGGSSAKTQQVVQTSEPPAYLSPYLQDIAGKASDAYKKFIANGYNMPYSGPRSAGQNSFDTQAMDMSTAAANNFANSGVPQTTFDLGKYLTSGVTSGKYTAPMNMAFNAGDNAALNEAINANVAPVMQNFTESIVPRLKSSAIDAGAYGGSKSQDLMARTARDTQQNIGNIAARLTYQDFINKRNLEQQDLAQRRALASSLFSAENAAAGAGTNLFNAGYQQELAPADTISNVGDRTRNFTQQDINDKLGYWNDLINSPFAGLDQYSSLINGTAGVAGKTGTSTTMGFQPSGASFLQGLEGLGMLGNGMTSLGGMLGGGSQVLPWLQGSSAALPWLASSTGMAAGASSLGRPR